MGNKISLDEQLIDLRIASKQMLRSAKKCEKNQQANIEKLKKVRTFVINPLKMEYTFDFIAFIKYRIFLRLLRKVMLRVPKFMVKM